MDAYEREKKATLALCKVFPLLGGCPLDTTNRYSRFDMDLGGVQPPAKLSSRPRFSLSLSVSYFSESDSISRRKARIKNEFDQRSIHKVVIYNDERM